MLRVKRWPDCGWSWPRYFNNIYRELFFGKFSIFFGKGKDYPGK